MIQRMVSSFLNSRSNFKTLVGATSPISKDIAVFGKYFWRLSRVQLDAVITKGSGRISRRSVSTETPGRASLSRSSPEISTSVEWNCLSLRARNNSNNSML